MHSRFTRWATGAIVALSLLGAAGMVQASSLTSAQVSAIIGLLQSFGADQSVINNVSSALGGFISGDSLSCSIFDDVSYGQFDNNPGGRVSQLQTFLGIPSSTFGFGTYGNKTRAAWNVKCGVVVPPTQTQGGLLDFTVSSPSGVAPASVAFYATFSGPDPVTSVDFGDGTSGSDWTRAGGGDKARYILHMYQSVGIFTAKLKDLSGNILSSKIVTIVGQASSDNTSFSATPAFGTTPLNVTFAYSVDIKHVVAPNYSVSFGDGTTGVMSVTNAYLSVSHMYSAAGTYTAILKDSSGNSLSATTITVNAVASANAPTCSTSVSSNSITVGQSYTLYWSSTNATYMTGIPLDSQDQPNGNVVFQPYSASTGKSYTLTFYGVNGQTTTCQTPPVIINPLSSGAPKLSIGVGPSQTPQSVAPGTHNGLGVLIELDASQSGEDISISSMPITFAGVGSDLTACQVFNGSSDLTTGPHMVNQPSQGQNIFTLDTPLIVPKGTVLNLSLTCNISSAAQAGNTYQFSMPNNGYQAVGVTSQTPAAISAWNGIYKAVLVVTSTVNNGSSVTINTPPLNQTVILPSVLPGYPKPIAGNITLSGTASNLSSIFIGLISSGAPLEGGNNVANTVSVYNGTWTASFGGITAGTYQVKVWDSESMNILYTTATLTVTNPQ